MNYIALANTTAVIHFISIVAVIAGLLLCFRYKRFRPFEAGALILIVVLWSYYGNCPFTILEEYFRTLASQPSGITNVGFLPYYAEKLFDIEFTSRTVQRTTFFVGGMIFAGSIEWLAPIMHTEVFKARALLRKLLRKKGGKRYA